MSFLGLPICKRSLFLMYILRMAGIHSSFPQKYWPFLVLGFVLFAYAGMGTIALALVGLALATLYVKGGLN